MAGLKVSIIQKFHCIATKHNNYDGPVLLGEPVGWREECQIKHLPTRMYLTVQLEEKKGFKVCSVRRV